MFAFLHQFVFYTKFSKFETLYRKRFLDKNWWRKSTPVEIGTTFRQTIKINYFYIDHEI